MAEISYTDFDLLIERLGENSYRVRVLFSPAGQAVSDTTLPFSPLELENFLLKIGRTRRGVRRLESPEMEAAKSFGGKLFKSIFQENILGVLRSSQEEAQKQDLGLRLRLRLNDAPELLNLPWEFLYNPTLNRFLSLSVSTPVVRYLELPERIKPLVVQPPLRMLVMISSPSDYPGLDVEREWGNLTTALQTLMQRGLLVMDRLEAATSLELQTRLRRNHYHIFHFIGHGGYNEQSQDGMLLFESESGLGRPISGQFLGTLLHDETSLRLVVLNACEGGRTSLNDPFAGVAQSLVQQGLPAVIAMQFEVTDQAAITFAREFYTAIADNYPVDAALAESRKAIFGLGNDIEWATPVLYMRASDGVIFDISKITQAAPQPFVPAPSIPQPSPTPVPLVTPEPQPTATAVTPSGRMVAAATPAGVGTARAPVASAAAAVPVVRPPDRRLLFALGGIGAVLLVILLALMWGKIFPASPTPPAVVVLPTTATSDLTFIPTTELSGAVLEMITPTPTSTPTTTPTVTPSITPTEPPPVVRDFNGIWLTNVASLIATQDGDKVFVSVQGYGGNLNTTIKGTIHGDQIEFPGTSFFGDVTIAMDKDWTSFKSADPSLSFCGVRSGSPLPNNCGFSGKWLLRSENLLPTGSYAVLLQLGSHVEGSVYKPGGDLYDVIKGDVWWGKGWGLDASGQDKMGSFTWYMSSGEMSFETLGGDTQIQGARDSAVIVVGRVVDSAQNPIAGIDVAATQGGARVDANSDSNGFFIATLPENSKGEWFLNIVGIDCKSRILNADCNLDGFFDLHTQQTIQIPQSEEVVFVYEISSAKLTGTILDSSGNPVQYVRVRAQRDDGAVSWVSTASDGKFSLPVSPGHWEVFTVDYNPYKEGNHISLDITGIMDLEPGRLSVP